MAQNYLLCITSYIDQIKHSVIKIFSKRDEIRVFQWCLSLAYFCYLLRFFAIVNISSIQRNTQINFERVVTGSFASITSATKQLLKMWHPGYRLRIFYFVEKLCSILNIFKFCIFNYPMSQQTCGVMMSMVHETGCIFEYIF